MSGLLPPLFLTIVGLVLAFLTYQGIRRGGARFYTLERESILRRATATLAASSLLFLGAIGLLLFERQQNLAQLASEAGELVEGVPTATPTLAIFPPTTTPTATIDANLPTPTATPRICRAIVQGTGESGLLLRDAPAGEEIETLQEEEIVNLLEDAPVPLNDIVWVKVKTTVTREEGWVALQFLFISDEECLIEP